MHFLLRFPANKHCWKRMVTSDMTAEGGSFREILASSIRYLTSISLVPLYSLLSSLWSCGVLHNPGDCYLVLLILDLMFMWRNTYSKKYFVILVPR
jgi:hypothetical protein